MVNEQEFFEKTFRVRKGVITSVDNSTESHTSGFGGGGDRFHTKPINITTIITRKSRVWVQFDGEEAPNSHFDFENDEFVCAPKQRIGILSLKTSGEVVAIGNGSSKTAIQLCDMEELITSLLIEEGHELPTWWIQRKGEKAGPFDFLNNADYAFRREANKGAAKLFGRKEMEDEYVFHYGKPDVLETGKYWLGAVGPAVLIALAIYLNTESALKPGTGAILAVLLATLAGAVGAVFAFFVRKFMQRNTPYGRFIRAGSVDKTPEWNAYMRKVGDIIDCAGRAVMN